MWSVIFEEPMTVGDSVDVVLECGSLLSDCVVTSDGVMWGDVFIDISRVMTWRPAFPTSGEVFH